MAFYSCECHFEQLELQLWLMWMITQWHYKNPNLSKLWKLFTVFMTPFDTVIHSKMFLLTAEIDGTTTKDMYKEFGLSLDD